jgi:hypothetical protein
MAEEDIVSGEGWISDDSSFYGESWHMVMGVLADTDEVMKKNNDASRVFVKALRLHLSGVHIPRT